MLCKNQDNSPGKRIIFNDDFEQSFLDLKHWNYDLGDGCPDLCGWGNREYQQYTKENVFIRDEKLVIKATKEGEYYYSGRITTKDEIEFQYGTVEVKAKLPKGWEYGQRSGCLATILKKIIGQIVEKLTLWSMCRMPEKFTQPFTQKIVMAYQKTPKFLYLTILRMDFTPTKCNGMKIKFHFL